MGAVSTAWSDRVYALGEAFRNAPGEVHLDIEQHLHAGVYSRTVFQPAGVVCAAVLIRIPTQLVVCGKARIYCDGGFIDVEGYRVLEGMAGRQIIVYTLEDTWGTMFFATRAKTFEEAEQEFAGDEYRLLSTQEKADVGSNHGDRCKRIGYGGFGDLFGQDAGQGDKASG